MLHLVGLLSSHFAHDARSQEPDTWKSLVTVRNAVHKHSRAHQRNLVTNRDLRIPVSFAAGAECRLFQGFESLFMIGNDSTKILALCGQVSVPADLTMGKGLVLYSRGGEELGCWDYWVLGAWVLGRLGVGSLGVGTTGC